MFRRIAGVAGALLAAGFLVSSVQAQATITLNLGTQYQTVEGLGAFGSIGPWKVRSGPFYVDVNLDTVGFYDTIVSELGATFIRSAIDDNYQTSSGVFAITAEMRDKFRDYQKLKAAAARQGESIKFIASVWSPPGFMKYSRVASGGGTIDPAFLTPFGQHVAKWLTTARDTFGIDFYAVSLQNEPAFDEPYSSCNYYSGDGYNTMFRAVAPVVRQTWPNMKFFGVEHMNWAFPGWENSIRNDATSRPLMYAWAVHGYQNGIASDTGSYTGSSPTDKELWMTETSGYGYGVGVNDWTNAMVLGRNILSFLRDGKISAWTWWSLQDICGTNGCEATDSAGYCLILNGTKTQKYYTSSHFYRFIRPGARQVQSTTSDAQVQVVAFRHQANDCNSIVLINTVAGTKTVNVTINGGTAPSQFLQVTSTSAAKLTRSTVGLTGITLPGNSITTLVSGQYAHTVQVGTVAPETRRAAGGAVAQPADFSVNIYTLDGKLVTTLNRGAYAAGRVQWNGRTASGLRAASGAYQAVLVSRDGGTVVGKASITVR
jgi:O-glycosyl hydrolase